MKRITTIILLLISFWANAQTGYLVQPAKWKFTNPQWLYQGAWIDNLSVNTGDTVLSWNPYTKRIGYKIITPGSTYTAGRGLTLNSNVFRLDTTKNYIWSANNTFSTSATMPLIIGGNSTTSPLTFKTTTGVGTTGADIHFLVGNNGGTEAMTILNNGNVGIGTTSPASRLHVGSAPTASANYGLVSLGDGAFDGATSGFFTGKSTGTLIAGNLASGSTSDLINLQVGGSSRFKMQNDGYIRGSHALFHSVESSDQLYKFTNFGRIQGISDGVLKLANNANNDFGLLQFGGTTSSFPALKRNATGLQPQLADDSGSARWLQGQGADVASASTITLGSGNSFELTGTTAVTLITSTGWTEGSIITLIANENVTITNGTATSGSAVTIKLAGATNFAMTADDTLTLILSSTTAGGVAWREVSRSVN